MLILACVQHWSSAAIFFGPVLLLGAWVWINGRRDRKRDSGDSAHAEP
jgi:hypothetical protein